MSLFDPNKGVGLFVGMVLVVAEATDSVNALGRCFTIAPEVCRTR